MHIYLFIYLFSSFFILIYSIYFNYFVYCLIWIIVILSSHQLLSWHLKKKKTPQSLLFFSITLTAPLHCLYFFTLSQFWDQCFFIENPRTSIPNIVWNMLFLTQINTFAQSPHFLFFHLEIFENWSSGFPNLDPSTSRWHCFLKFVRRRLVAKLQITEDAHWLLEYFNLLWDNCTS